MVARSGPFVLFDQVWKITPRQLEVDNFELHGVLLLISTFRNCLFKIEVGFVGFSFGSVTTAFCLWSFFFSAGFVASGSGTGLRLMALSLPTQLATEMSGNSPPSPRGFAANPSSGRQPSFQVLEAFWLWLDAASAFPFAGGFWLGGWRHFRSALSNGGPAADARLR